jgi:hypothetical protein
MEDFTEDFKTSVIEFFYIVADAQIIALTS